MARPEIYLRSISKRWKKEASGPSPNLAIVSPYITSQTAERVISASKKRPVTTVITLFNVEVFASGASSLKTLRKLMQLGCEIFHIQNLHAKIFLSDNFASIGSQNLTTGGAARNEEATVAVTDERSLSKIRTGVLDWKRNAHPVTKEMIEHMMEVVPPLRRNYLALQRKYNDAETAFSMELLGRKREEEKRQEEARKKRERRRLKREEEAQRLIAIEKKIASRSTKFSEALQETQPSNAIPVLVTFKKRQDQFFDTYHYLTMAVRNPQRYDMTRWVIAGERYPIPRVSSCLIVNETNGRLSYVRVMKRQTNRFFKGIKLIFPLKGWKRWWFLEVLFADTDDELADWNVCFIFWDRKTDYTIKSKGRADWIAFNVFANFSVTGLEIVRITSPNDYISHSMDSDDLRAALEQQDEGIIKVLTHYLLSRNRGRGWISTITPSEFFGNSKTNWLRLHKFGDYLFLGSRPSLY